MVVSSLFVTQSHTPHFFFRAHYLSLSLPPGGAMGSRPRGDVSVGRPLLRKRNFVRPGGQGRGPSWRSARRAARPPSSAAPRGRAGRRRPVVARRGDQWSPLPPLSSALQSPQWRPTWGARTRTPPGAAAAGAAAAGAAAAGSRRFASATMFNVIIQP